MKKRLEEAMNDVYEAEEIIPLLKEAIAKFELVPSDLFEVAALETKAAPSNPPKGLRRQESKLAINKKNRANPGGGKADAPNG